MALNQELRKERRTHALPDASGHVAFQMSAMSYYFWTDRYPDLKASDPQIARNAWRKFLNSDEGQRFKINPHEGKRAPATRIVVK